MRTMIMSSIGLPNLPFFNLVGYYYSLVYGTIRFVTYCSSTLHEPSGGTPLHTHLQTYVAWVHGCSVTLRFIE